MTGFKYYSLETIFYYGKIILHGLCWIILLIGIVCVLFGLITFVLYLIECGRSKKCSSNEYQELKSDDSKDMKDSPTGLQNSSTECYINAIIQAIAASDVFIEQCETLNVLHAERTSLSIFLKLLHYVNSPGNSRKSIEKSTELLELIRSTGWNKQSQQDAFDVFSALIYTIHRELNYSRMADFQMPIKVKLVHRFTGMDIPDKIQYHLGLSMGLCGNYAKSPGESLEYLISQHFSPTIIDDDPSKTTQMFFYQQTPDVLLIHIQANKWDPERGEMVKPEYYIRYKREMIQSFVIVTETGEKKEENVNYQLKAVVHHLGTISGGHYVTYREYKGNWYLVNDEDVANVEFDPQIVPYIMIYEKNKDSFSEICRC